MKSVWILALLLSFFSIAVSNEEANLVKNGDFSQNSLGNNQGKWVNQLPGWFIYGRILLRKSQIKGQQAVLFPSKDLFISQTIEVEPGVKYQLSFDYAQTSRFGYSKGGIVADVNEDTTLIPVQNKEEASFNKQYQFDSKYLLLKFSGQNSGVANIKLIRSTEAPSNHVHLRTSLAHI